MAQDRLTTLDGLRGIAALAVVLYHFGARWAVPEHPVTLYNHGTLLTNIPGILQFGSFGIFLFFLISGFVIMMTLERCHGPIDFVLRRVARLWPVMLVCATLTTLIIEVSEYPLRFESAARFAITPIEYVSSIFFISPDILGSLVGENDAGWVDGVYWTLWSEVRFYGFIAIVYWVVPRNLFPWAWLHLQTAATWMIMAENNLADLPFKSVFHLILQPYQLDWFSLGIAGYYFFKGKLTLPVLLFTSLGMIGVFFHLFLTFEQAEQTGIITMIAVLAAITLFSLFTSVIPIPAKLSHQLGRGGSFWLIAGFALLFLLTTSLILKTAPVLRGDSTLDNAVLLACIWGLFFVFLIRRKWLAVVEHPWILAVGFASYPLYMFHDRVGLISMQILVDWGAEPYVALLVVFAAVIITALLIHKYVEIPARNLIIRSLKPLVIRAESPGVSRQS